MNLNRKVEIAKQAIDSILTHDDALFEAVQMAADELVEHIDKRGSEARERRMAKAREELKP